MNYKTNIQNKMSQMKYPTRQLEAWKYTSTQAIQDFNFQNFEKTVILTEKEHDLLNQYKVDGFEHLVIVNGQIQHSLSTLSQPKWISAFEAHDYDEILKKSEDSKNIFEVQNYYYAQMNKIQIPKNGTLNKPLQIIHLTTESAQGHSTHQFLKIEMGEFSKLVVMQTYIGATNTQYLQNNETIFHLQPSANLELVRVELDSSQAYHIGRTQVYLQKQAQLESLSVTLKAKMSRHELQVHLCGEYANAKAYGLYLTAQSQHADHQTWINHLVGNCDTDQLYKGILADQSRAVFDGLVYIHPQAQKANSAQLNNNLLLSSKAEIDTKPQLEIFADDVKASHGSTVGQMNEEEVFYFMSRAISKADALNMLSLGYASEVVYKISNTQIQNWLLPILLNHLKENQFSEVLKK